MSWWRRKPQTSTSEGAHEPDGTTNGPVIRLEKVSRVFRGDADEDTYALRDVDLIVNRGEYVCVSGPSGCGKSTLLSVLGLLDAPTAGRYWLNGRPTDRMTPGERARARSVEIGLIFQSFNLIGDLSVYENVEYPLTLRSVGPSERKAIVESALERVGMTARAKQRPGVLSGGHQQLVAIARAIAGRPSVLLADEPTGNLDSRAGEALMELVAELHRDGATVCMATHDPRWIAQAPRHLYLFDGGVATQ
jgi:putative ABC transport system ATP-binding protein